MRELNRSVGSRSRSVKASTIEMTRNLQSLHLSICLDIWWRRAGRLTFGWKHWNVEEDSELRRFFQRGDNSVPLRASLGCSAQTPNSQLGFARTHKLVTDARDRDDQHRMAGILLEFFAQAGHVHVDGARQCTALIAPDRA
jgi:hypothetical protein